MRRITRGKRHWLWGGVRFSTQIGPLDFYTAYAAEADMDAPRHFVFKLYLFGRGFTLRRFHTSLESAQELDLRWMLTLDK